MENLLKKFNIFDLFIMLIPGVIILTLSCISLSFEYYDRWTNWEKEKYVIFFVISYLLGIVFQQLGNIVDQKWIYRHVYGGSPREIFLLKDKYMKILNNELAYKDALNIKKYLIDYFDIDTKNIRNIEQQKQLNARIFSYCLNIVEINGLSFKADKMLVISEMSSSLSLGFISIILLNLLMILFFHFHYVFFLMENIILLFLVYIFFDRKKQYEKYRYIIILRMFSIYMRDKEIK